MELKADLRKTSVSFEQLGRLVEERALYAIVDSVNCPRVPEKMIRLSGEKALSLYAGTPFEAYTAVVPWLTSLDAELLDWLVNDLWLKPWGILVFSRASLPDLFQHFRRFWAARMPNGTSAIFRFQDPRILPIFLASDEAAHCGFWNGIAAYGWSDGDAAAMVKRPEAIAQMQHYPNREGMEISASLVHALESRQMQGFIERCIAYLNSMETVLPADRCAFFESVLRYARSVGIVAELDLVRFIKMVLTWKELRSIAVVREILANPEVSGTDKVDLLCELAAFGSFEQRSGQQRGLDPESNARAGQRLLDELVNDKEFLSCHSDGPLTMSQADTRWRKVWVRLYCEEVAKRAQVTRVPVGLGLSFPVAPPPDIDFAARRAA